MAETSSSKPERFGAELKAIREEQGLTQEDLAKRSGVTQRYICKIEGDLGGGRLGGKVIVRLAAALDLDPTEWLDRFQVSPTSEEITIWKEAVLLEAISVFNFGLDGEDLTKLTELQRIIGQPLSAEFIREYLRTTKKLK